MVREACGGCDVLRCTALFADEEGGEGYPFAIDIMAEYDVVDAKSLVTKHCYRNEELNLCSSFKGGDTDVGE